MWRTRLKEIVTYFNSNGVKPDPAFLYEVNPPVDLPFLTTIPAPESLRDFYQLCDGGFFGPMIRFIPLARLESETDRWIRVLKDYDDRGDVLSKSRHCVFANDADGTPWICDNESGEVASFYWKGGDWCDPRFASFDAFMEDLLSHHSDDEDWSTMLDLVPRSGGTP